MIQLRDIQHPAADLYSDLHKDAYGFRPTNPMFESEESFKSELAHLDEMISDSIDRERTEERKAKDKFTSTVINIQDAMQTTREDAVAMLIDSYELTEMVNWYGFEYAEHELGLPYDFIQKFLNGDD